MATPRWRTCPRLQSTQPDIKKASASTVKIMKIMSKINKSKFKKKRGWGYGEILICKLHGWKWSEYFVNSYKNANSKSNKIW